MNRDRLELDLILRQFFAASQYSLRVPTVFIVLQTIMCTGSTFRAV